MAWRHLLPCLLALLSPAPAAAALVGRYRAASRSVASPGADAAPSHAPSHGPVGNLSPANESGCNCSANSTFVHNIIAKCKVEEGAEAVAVGLIFAVMVIPIVLFMAMREGAMSFLVLKLVDTTISIFLALLWFSAFSTILQSEYVHSLFPFAEEIIAVTQVAMLYVIVMLIAYLWRDKDIRLMTLSSCGAHYVAFAGIRATGETQFETSKFFGKDYGHWASILIGALGFALLGLVFRVFHILFLRRVGHHKLDEVVEEMELDIIGLTGSFAVTQAVRHFLTGRYPPTAHLLLFLEQHLHGGGSLLWPATTPAPTASEFLSLEGGPDGHPASHGVWPRRFMLVWAMGLTVIAAIWLMYLDQYGDFTGRFARKCSHVMRVLLIMCIAWGYLLWGQWAFEENFFVGHPLLGQMSFAVLATACSLAFIFLIASLDLQRRSARHFTNIGVMGASLVAAWSWEHCFSSSLNIIGDKYQVGLGGLVPKATLALVIPAAVLPVYVTYIKPQIMDAEWAGSDLDLLQTHHTHGSARPTVSHAENSPEHSGSAAAHSDSA